MIPRSFHIYVDNVFIETIESTLPMWGVMNQVFENNPDYKTSLEVHMMGGHEPALYRFRGTARCN